MAEKDEPLPAKGVGQAEHVVGHELEGVCRLSGRLGARAMATQIGRYRMPARISETVEPRREILLGPGEAVHEQQRPLSGTRLRYRELDVAHLDDPFRHSHVRTPLFDPHDTLLPTADPTIAVA
jgi:hypothetical protein